MPKYRGGHSMEYSNKHAHEDISDSGDRYDNTVKYHEVVLKHLYIVTGSTESSVRHTGPQVEMYVVSEFGEAKGFAYATEVATRHGGFAGGITSIKYIGRCTIPSKAVFHG